MVLWNENERNVTKIGGYKDYERAIGRKGVRLLAGRRWFMASIEVWYTGNVSCGCSTAVSIQVFQTWDRGSIPRTRTSIIRSVLLHFIFKSTFGILIPLI